MPLETDGSGLLLARRDALPGSWDPIDAKNVTEAHVPLAKNSFEVAERLLQHDHDQSPYLKRAQRLAG